MVQFYIFLSQFEKKNEKQGPKIIFTPDQFCFYLALMWHHFYKKRMRFLGLEIISVRWEECGIE